MVRGAVLLTVLAAGGCGLRENRAAMLHQHQLEAARTRYEAAPDNLGRCVAAKMVAVAYRDLGNTADEGAWRAKERVDCQAAYADLGPVTDLGAPSQ